jgi:hypothetical protein
MDSLYLDCLTAQGKEFPWTLDRSDDQPNQNRLMVACPLLYYRETLTTEKLLGSRRTQRSLNDHGTPRFPMQRIKTHSP